MIAQRKGRPDRFTSTSLSVTFEIGRMVQEYVVHTLASTNSTVGDWRCDHCGELHEFMLRPNLCRVCKCPKLKQQEVRLYSQKSGISCGIDMFQVVDEKYKIIEIKTIGPEDFKNLVGPLAEHKLRTNLYLRVADECDHPHKERFNTEEATVLYVSKGGFGCKDDTVATYGIKDQNFSPFKEFTIKRDDEQTNELVFRAKRLDEYKKGAKGIPLGVCPTSYCKRASKCQMVKDCFSGSFPADET